MQLWDPLFATSESIGGAFVWREGRYSEYSWGEMLNRARRQATALRRAGVERGATVAAVLTNSLDCATAVVGSWLAGAAVASLPAPARGMSLEAYARQLEQLLDRLDTDFLFADEQICKALNDSSSFVPDARTWGSLSNSVMIDPDPPEADDVAFIQFSSGSTGSPKGCVLTSQAICTQERMVTGMVDARPTDRVVSWLPLSHDMGLFGGFLHPWFAGYSLVLSTPQRFVASPASWMNDCATSGATITVGPSSTLWAVARAAKSSPPKRALKLRSFVVGAERVDWLGLTSAVEALGDHGLDLKTFQPAYGLAEATLAVTAVPLHEPPRTVSIDSRSIENRRVVHVSEDAPSSIRLTSAGPPLPGVRVDIDGPATVGRIVIESSSLATGYLADETLSKERFGESSYLSDDLGFLDGGELFVVGRTDDMISVAGRKVFCTEIETRLAQEPEVRSNCCAMIDVPGNGSPGLIAVVELRVKDVNFTELAARLGRISRRVTGIVPDEVLFVPRSTLPKTASGKIQRFRCRQLLIDGGFRAAERVRLRDHTPVR